MTLRVMKAALQSANPADFLAVAAMVLPAAALSLSRLLDQSMRRPSLAGLLLHSARVVF